MKAFRMTSSASVSVEAIRDSYPLICAWLTGGGVDGAGMAPVELLAAALDQADDPDFIAQLKLAAEERAATGAPLSTILSNACAALNSGLGETLAVDGAAIAGDDLTGRHERLTKVVLGAISEAWSGPDQPVLNGDDQSRSNVEASLDAIKKINAAANSSLDLKETTQLTAQAITDVMQVDECSVFILDEQTDQLVLHATYGMNPELVDKASLAIGEGITGMAAELGKPIAVRDAWNDPRFHFIPDLHEEKYRSMLVVPIVSCSR